MRRNTAMDIYDLAKRSLASINDGDTNDETFITRSPGK